MHKSFLVVAEYPSYIYKKIYKNYGKISVRDAFTLLKTNMRCNIDYHSNNLFLHVISQLNEIIIFHVFIRVTSMHLLVFLKNRILKIKL